ncbi:MAG: hypothetical protein HY537_05595 [Deltaproteobacteria bacterium]|nr:hypothetical protein [Deltaproteobacteria bacterium]
MARWMMLTVILSLFGFSAAGYSMSFYSEFIDLLDHGPTTHADDFSREVWYGDCVKASRPNDLQASTAVFIELNGAGVKKRYLALLNEKGHLEKTIAVERAEEKIRKTALSDIVNSYGKIKMVHQTSCSGSSCYGDIWACLTEDGKLVVHDELLHIACLFNERKILQ